MHGGVVVAAVAEREALVPARDGQLKPLTATDDLDCHRPAYTADAAAVIIAFLILLSYSLWIPELDMVKP
jgi:hypothetical protein